MNKIILSLLIALLFPTGVFAQNGQANLEPALQRVAAQAIAKAKQPIKRCIFCNRVQTAENAHSACPEDIDSRCVFDKVSLEQTENPLTSEEIAHAQLLTDALKALEMIAQDVSAQDIALALRAAQQQDSFEYTDPHLEVSAETVISHIQNTMDPAEQAKNPYTHEEVLSLLVFLNDMGK